MKKIICILIAVLTVAAALTFASSAAPERIGSVEVTFSPPAPNYLTYDIYPGLCVSLPENAHCSITDARWCFKVADDLYMDYEGVFEDGKTYYLALRIDADEGYVFNQGGPYGYTTVTVTNGRPLYDELFVTNTMDSEGGFHSYGTVMIEFEPGLPGDVNVDGAVDMKDVLLLRRRIAGIVFLEHYQERRADVNEDDSVNMKDVLMLRRLIAGLA